MDNKSRVSSLIATLRPPPSAKTGRALFSVSKNHHHEKPQPVRGFRVQEEESSEDSLPPYRRPRSDSEGLDCLAALAEKEWAASSSPFAEGTEQASTSGSSSEDEETMPPPPSRRPRSNSSPESLTLGTITSSTLLVLPEEFLEMELAEARAARSGSPPSIPEDSEWHEADPAELLKETRSRLLEDLSQSSLQQRRSSKLSKVLPHDLEKYKDVYNKKGHVGIYTPRERAAILARFHDKRQRRTWNKKVRYNCRKSLADRRLRVKGRFVKADDENMPDTSDAEAGFAPTIDQPYRRSRRNTIT